MKKVKLLIVIGIIGFILTACSAQGPNDYYGEGREFDPNYTKIVEFPFIDAQKVQDVYFTMDSNTGSYANIRNRILNGNYISGDMIKTDELINYFSYDFDDPAPGETFSIRSDMMVCPWNEENHLITIGVATKEVKLTESKGNNLVFLIDVSGSMSASNKLELIKKAFPLMLDNLNSSDTISIVTYSTRVKVVLEATKVSNRHKIISVINSLSPSGGTNGNSGLLKAYDIAEESFIEGGNNRIILATDGDFNVGPSSNDEMRELVTERKDSGIYLSVLGVGMGNYRDSKVETLARYGNGNYAYIDSLIEAEKVLSEELTTTLLTVAKDVKVNVTFNPDVIEQYRVIGYENKQLSDDEFNDETTDASELGSGSQTVVTYEVTLKEGAELLASNTNILTTTVNYKEPTTDKLQTYCSDFLVEDISKETKEDFIFVACVVEFSLILRNSEYKGDASLNEIIETLELLECTKTDVYKEEFLELVKKVKSKDLIA